MTAPIPFLFFNRPETAGRVFAEIRASKAREVVSGGGWSKIIAALRCRVSIMNFIPK